MIDGLDRHVYIEIGPVKMMRMWELDVAQLADRNVAKPGKVLECEEPLPLTEHDPKTMLGNVRDLND